jgi:hypothetical protein
VRVSVAGELCCTEIELMDSIAAIYMFPRRVYEAEWRTNMFAEYVQGRYKRVL